MLTIFFGSQWWCLNDPMVKYLDEYPTYIRLFKHSLCPDECFFQTLVINSQYANSVLPYLHFIK